MSLLRQVLAEFFGLFIDDLRLAVGVVVWVALGVLLLQRLLPAPWGPILFAAGMGALLLESVLRRARS